MVPPIACKSAYRTELVSELYPHAMGDLAIRADSSDQIATNCPIYLYTFHRSTKLFRDAMADIGAFEMDNRAKILLSPETICRSRNQCWEEVLEILFVAELTTLKPRHVLVEQSMVSILVRTMNSFPRRLNIKVKGEPLLIACLTQIHM